MLIRIVTRSLSRRKRRKLLSLAAVALGITVATTVATIALDVGDRVSRELRSFGANISVTPAADGLPVVVGGVDYRPAGAGAFLREADLPRIKKIFWRNNVTAFSPFLYLPVQLKSNVPGRGATSAVLVGSWFDHRLEVDKAEAFETGLEKLRPEWRITGAWPSDHHDRECLVGRRLAGRLGLSPGATLNITAWPRAGTLDHLAGLGEERRTAARLNTGNAAPSQSTVTGILDSGGPEDDQVLAPLGSVQKLGGLEDKIRRVEVSALTKPEDAFGRRDPKKMSPEELERWSCSPYVRSIAYQIQDAIPGSQAKPILQVADTEGRILDRVAALMWILVAAALVTAALAVASTMLATVLERRAEIALLEALGATGGRVISVFLLEACIVGLLGGAAGYLAGSVMARRLAVSLFGSPASFHWVIFPTAVLIAMGVAVAGSMAPLLKALKLSPAMVLRD